MQKLSASYMVIEFVNLWAGHKSLVSLTVDAKGCEQKLAAQLEAILRV